MSRLLRRVSRIVLLAMGLAAVPFPAVAQEPPKDKQAAKAPKRKVGMLANSAGAWPGYTLISPLTSKTTYLIDLEGRIVHTWEGAANPQLCGTLFPNGNLLRPCAKGLLVPIGTGGRIQEFTWDGAVVWDYTFPDAKYFQHHDTVKMPNGNYLTVVYERKTKEQCAATGCKDGSALEVDAILELRPNGKDGADIVWQWHLWDHLVQDHDEAKPNFGVIAAHPELVDINAGRDLAQAIGKGKTSSTLQWGQIPGGNWAHVNAIDYHPDWDVIMISVNAFSEIWVIDHSTTTAETAGHTGGKRGKGGDLLYRWGNPQNYGGAPIDRFLFHQHHAHWIPKGLPGAGNVMLFNNGLSRPGGAYSSVEEVALAVDPDGAFHSRPETPFVPAKSVWSYAAPKKSDFYAQFISSAQRLPNGNTLVCAGTSGTIFEVTSKGETVWKYVNPFPPGIGGLGSWVFRAYRYGLDNPALSGRTLTPGRTIEETLAKGK